MTMGIDWSQSERGDMFRKMEHLFLELGKDAILMNHYDLAETFAHTGLNSSDWRDFLAVPKVAAYIADEFEVIKSTELRKIVTDINNSNSMGKAQIINSLSKMLEGKDEQKTGPAFIYCYVPLNQEQIFAENVEVLDNDPFIREGTTVSNEQALIREASSVPTRGRKEIVRPQRGRDSE